MQLFTSALTLAAVAGSAIAAPAQEQCTTPKPFTALALRSASPVHFMPFTVKDLTVVLGEQKPTTYCPTAEVKNCPPGNVTAFAVSGGRAGMDTEVPGGQALYVNKDGQLMITVPHSGAIPNGAITQGFHYEPSADGSVGEFSFSGGEATGFLACKPEGSNTYGVYANVKGAKLPSDCLGINAGTTPYTSNQPAAWQYE